MTYKSFRNKFDSASKFVNKYNLYSLYDGSLDGMSVKTTQKRLRAANRILNKYGNIDANVSNAFEYRMFLANRRYNIALFGQLLLRIFTLLAPIIIISVILSKDGNFKFDFFQFVNRFATMQMNFSKPLLDFIKSCSKWSNNTLSLDAYADGFWEQALNILKIIGQIGVVIFQVLSCLGFIITFILDFFTNVFAFFSAIAPSIL